MRKDKPCCAVAYIPHTVCPTCQKCTAGCPAQIDIPRALRIYADCRGGGTELIEQLRGLPSRNQPLDCIMCGACTDHCPQGIDVRHIIRELARQQR